MRDSKRNFVFFGSSDFSIFVLEELKKAVLIPSLIVTTPDKPAGRAQTLTPSPVKTWAQANNIPTLEPHDLKNPEFVSQMSQVKSQMFIVASYGKIIPKEMLEIPEKGVLNVHPSLLPLYRGPSPLQSQILDGAKNIGVSIMLIDEKVDHGPILAQEKISMPRPLPNTPELTKILGVLGGDLLAKTIPKWLEGSISPQEQDHSKATFTNSIKKEDGLIDPNGNALTNWRKFKAFTPWPGIYFNLLHHTGPVRVIIKDADYKDEDSPAGNFIIKRVTPEGKKEMDYTDFLRGFAQKS